MNSLGINMTQWHDIVNDVSGLQIFVKADKGSKERLTWNAAEDV